MWVHVLGVGNARRHHACVFGLLFLGCQGPAGVKAPPGESSSGGSGTTSIATTTGAATSGGGSDPSRLPPLPFELPAGCGDGVITPSQYDCFFPLPLDWVDEETGGSFDIQPLDLEGDGRDELVVADAGWYVAVLRWEADQLLLGPAVDSPLVIGSSTLLESRWDWNSDGRGDLTLSSIGDRGIVAMHPSFDDEGLGEQALMHVLPPVDRAQGSYGATGRAVPIDVDADGMPELLVSMQVDAIGYANPVEDLVLFRRSIGDVWEPVGDAYRWGPCGLLSAVAYGDFDRDGDEDMAVLDHGQACDPYPTHYDPEWYQVGILLSDSKKGVLELGGWYPVGGAVSDPKIWAEDVTNDGYVDFVVRISEVAECDTPGSGLCTDFGLAVMRGLEDGSFEEGYAVNLDPVLKSYRTEALIDVDGDGHREWIVSLVDGRPWVIPFDLSNVDVVPLVALNDPLGGGITRFKDLAGDLNGDGVDDYRVRASQGPYRGDFLMMSSP